MCLYKLLLSWRNAGLTLLYLFCDLIALSPQLKGNRLVCPLGEYKLPEPIVIKQFHPKEGAEKVLSNCSINLPYFALVMNIFLLPRVFFIEYTPNPLYLQRGLYLLLLCIYAQNQQLLHLKTETAGSVALRSHFFASSYWAPPLSPVC